MIKSAFNFILTFQVMQLFVFLYFFIQNDLFVTIPFNITITSDFAINFEIAFNIGSLIGFMVAISVILILAGIQAVGSGLNDSANNSLKKVITLYAMFTLLSFPTYYIFGLSEYLIQYASAVVLICFMVYTIYFFTNDNEGG